MTTEEAARECIEKIGSALGFFSSVIKSGESWSETCEDEMTRVRTALANYRAAETGARVEREPRGCPTPGACSCIDLVPDAASDIRISQVARIMHERQADSDINVAREIFKMFDATFRTHRRNIVGLREELAALRYRLDAEKRS